MEQRMYIHVGITYIKEGVNDNKKEEKKVS